VNDGYFRVLRALARERSVSASALVERSGEPPSVIRALSNDHGAWLSEHDGSYAATDLGLAAFAREIAQRTRADDTSDAAVVERLREVASRRGTIKRELDQVYATLETTARRARHLIERGDVQRGLCLLGDDDLLSLALFHAGVDRPVTVIELDPDLVALYRAEAEREGFDLRVQAHDLREPPPKELRERFGAVFSDPPYAKEGFALFVSRAIEVSREDAFILVCFGASRRAYERGLEKQRVLIDAGLLVLEVLPDFNEYEGAQAIGSRSALVRSHKTPGSRPLPAAGGPLYTRRSPRSRRSKSNR
jgi:N4-bis(aminopropyl)spermidine synthase